MYSWGNVLGAAIVPHIPNSIDQNALANVGSFARAQTEASKLSGGYVS